VFGLPSYYYEAPLTNFDADNEFYCEPKKLRASHIKGTCELSDAINGNPPLLGSYAHLINADPKLFEPFEGLKPDMKRHTPHAYLNPRIGMIMKGSLIWQLNVKVTSFRGHYEKFNGLILPLAWMELTIDELPLRFKIMLFMVSPVSDILEIILMYGSIFSFLYSIFYLMKILIKNSK
jgi:hypothetical protein